MTDKYRMRYASIVIQPKIDSKFWLINDLSDFEIEKKLMDSGFLLYTEVKYCLENLKVLTLSKKSNESPIRFVFGTETSKETKIPHYQIYVEFASLTRITRIYEELDKLCGNRVHIATLKVYNEKYSEYCLKTTSNFEFESKYYWNIKYSSDKMENSKDSLKKMMKLRPDIKNDRK